MDGQPAITQAAQSLHIGRKIICGKVSVPPNQLRTRPSAVPVETLGELHR